MAGSIMVRYAKKTSKQLNKERSGSHAQMKNIKIQQQFIKNQLQFMLREV